MESRRRIIPKQLYLGSQKIKIVRRKNIMKKLKVLGVAYFYENKILIQAGDDEDSSYDQKELAYMHELVHMILCMMGEHKLNANEKFVEDMANLLLQERKSARY